MGARDNEVARTVDGIIEELNKRQFQDAGQVAQFLSQAADKLRRGVSLSNTNESNANHAAAFGRDLV